jgi:hypothetical protein
LREEKTGGNEFSCGATKVWEGLNGMSTGPDMLLIFREDRTTGNNGVVELRKIV